MLSGIRSTSEEILGAGLRKTEAEDDKVLCFAGRARTPLSFSIPSNPHSDKGARLRAIQRDFKQSNASFLADPALDSSKLIVSHEDILGTGPSLSQLV